MNDSIISARQPRTEHLLRRVLGVHKHLKSELQAHFLIISRVTRLNI